MRTEKKRILVTVKAYPNPSNKYSETVCIAGVDIEKNKWIRIFPIQFRDLDDPRKFKKYSIIEVEACKSTDDKRPESYKIIQDSIKIIDHYDTKDNWERRKKIVLPLADESMCEILKNSESKNQSLGLFKPHKISFHWKKAPPEDKKKKQSCYSQLSLYNKSKDAIEHIPFRFQYSYHCHGEKNCLGHTHSIIDWEMGQCYRHFRTMYPEDILFEKIKDRWLNMNCSGNKDIYFYTGNMKRFHDKFMILGVFYPPE